MNLCAYESEDHEHRVGAGVNSTLMSDTLWSIDLGESSASRAKVWEVCPVGNGNSTEVLT